MQQPAEQHVRRRATAAAAAAASEIRPINAKKAPKRLARSGSGASSSSAPPPATTTTTATTATTATTTASSAPAALIGEDHGIPGTEGACVAGKASEPPPNPPGPLPRDENGSVPLMQDRAGIDADESYGSQEHALSSYLKLHPVLSLESTSCQTLQLVANLVEDTSIPTKELEVVPKPHDDAYLRPPNVSIGERPCCLGDRCICVWLARWRYGDDTDMAFIGTEFLLPSEATEFKKSGKLPHTQGKCLVCSRYVTTYIYRCARADPTFKPSASIPLQAFGNSLGVEAGENVPTHASVANDVDGYRQEALLFVDEQWADTAAARGSMASLLWRPCVKFDSQHYEYVKDHTGLPRMLQRNVGAEDELPEAHFRQPAGGTRRPPLPANPQATPPTRPSPPSQN